MLLVWTKPIPKFPRLSIKIWGWEPPETVLQQQQKQHPKLLRVLWSRLVVSCRQQQLSNLHWLTPRVRFPSQDKVRITRKITWKMWLSKPTDWDQRPQFKNYRLTTTWRLTLLWRRLMRNQNLIQRCNNLDTLVLN